MFHISFFLFLTVIINHCRARNETTNYTGYQVFEIKLTTREQANELMKLAIELKLDIWRGPSIQQPTDILVPPNLQYKTLITDFFKTYNLKESIKIPDVQKLIDEEAVIRGRAMKLSRGQMSWDNYYFYEDIKSYLEEVARQNPLLVNLTSIGKTYEGRELLLVKITLAQPGSGPNPEGVFIDAGMHAREWVTPAVGTYIIDQLTKNHTAYESLLRNYIFYIIPMLNPDGYEFTNKDRMWRKNRALNKGSCIGVDLNRNFEYKWSSSSSPCEETYSGSFPCSELECQAMTKFIQGHKDITTYFSLHTFGQYWMYPYSYDERKPPNDAELFLIAGNATAALWAVHGTYYYYGSAGVVFIYLASGVSIDWAYATAKLNYSYILELRGPDDTVGFMLPPSQILPTAEETWAGIQVAVMRINTNITRDDPDNCGRHNYTPLLLFSLLGFPFVFNNDGLII